MLILTVSQQHFLLDSVVFFYGRYFLKMKLARWFLVENRVPFLSHASNPTLSTCSSNLFSFWARRRMLELPPLSRGFFLFFPLAWDSLVSGDVYMLSLGALHVAEGGKGVFRYHNLLYPVHKDIL
jgi:hypothetical protein